MSTRDRDGRAMLGWLLLVPALAGCALASRPPIERYATAAEALWLAAKEDRAGDVRRLLVRGVPGDALPPALGAAAAAGALRTLDLLLEAGVDLDLPVDLEGRTAVHAGVRHPAVLERLLDAGATLDARDRRGLTPLLEAARMGSAEGLRLLVRRGADPLATTRDGANALHLAAAWGHSEALALLLEGNLLDVDAAATVRSHAVFHDRRAELTPLMLAAHNGTLNAVDLLLRAGAHPGAGNDSGETPLMVAAWTGREAVVDRLLGAGADPDAADEDGETALLMAARGGHRAVVERLVRAGASPWVESPPESGAVAVLPGLPWDAELLELLVAEAQAAGAPLGPDAADLLYSAAGGWPEAVRILLAAGVSPDAESRTRFASPGAPGRRPLSSAVRKRNLETATLLIEAGADVSYVMAGSYLTPLGWAVMTGDTRMADLLRRAGAVEPDLLEPTPLARLENALRDGDDRAALDLVAAGAHLDDPPRALEAAVRGGRARAVEAMLDDLEGRAATPAGGFDDRLVRLAVLGGPPYCTEGHARTLELLVERGLAVDKRGARGHTALMSAADEGCARLLRALLRAGARPNLQDEEGWTALMLAVNPFSEHDPALEREMAGALLDHGAEVTVRNADGATALVMAAVVGRRGLLRLLLSHVGRRDEELVREARAVALEAGNLPAVELFDHWLGR